MIERPTLIVMAKAPRLGQGKSRLAAELGRVEAWRINRALHTLTLRAAHDPRWRTLLCVTPDSAVATMIPRVWPRKVARVAQGRGDLGARLARAFNGRRRVAVIGTDCPAISRAHIAAAFKALTQTQFAMGRAEDGGFWLLAARDGRAAAQAMTGVRWSTARAADDVLRNLGEASVQMLPTLRDVDVSADLAAYREAKRPSSGV